VSKILYHWFLSLASIRFCETKCLHFTTRVFGHSEITPFLHGIQYHVCIFFYIFCMYTYMAMDGCIHTLPCMYFCTYITMYVFTMYVKDMRSTIFHMFYVHGKKNIYIYIYILFTMYVKICIPLFSICVHSQSLYICSLYICIWELHIYVYANCTRLEYVSAVPIYICIYVYANCTGLEYVNFTYMSTPNPHIYVCVDSIYMYM